MQSIPAKRKNVYKIRRITFSLLLVAVLTIIIIIGNNSIKIISTDQPAAKSFAAQKIAETEIAETTAESIVESISEAKMVYPSMTAATATFESKLVNNERGVLSEHGILVDVDANTILAQKDCDARIYPASLTKIMTLIVAVENTKDLNATFTMTNAILEPLINQQATRAGFEDGEQVKMIDMMYGAILPSGADATIGLAQAISGSESGFVSLMNAKVQAMGLKNTHFMNTSGLHDDNHYTTAVDMSMIIKYAMENELCRQILSTYQYTTAATPIHPQGIALESTMFSRMYGTEVENVTILGGKMGYTDEAGNCLASFAVKNGKEYIAVTTNGAGKYAPIFDSFAIYKNYLG